MSDKVIFKLDKGPEHDVYAVFPEIPFSIGGTDDCMIYAHCGQHGSASIDYVRESKPANFQQYQDLYYELTNDVGYDLDIVKRISSKMTATRLYQLNAIDGN